MKIASVVPVIIIYVCDQIVVNNRLSYAIYYSREFKDHQKPIISKSFMSTV
jgi:hypothetical protein